LLERVRLRETTTSLGCINSRLASATLVSRTRSVGRQNVDGLRNHQSTAAAGSRTRNSPDTVVPADYFTVRDGKITAELLTFGPAPFK
jgi:hypothetical protein